MTLKAPKTARKTPIKAITARDLRRAGVQAAISWIRDGDGTAYECFDVSVEVSFQHPKELPEAATKALNELTHGKPSSEAMDAFDDGFTTALESIHSNLENAMCDDPPDVSDYLPDCVDINVEQILSDLAGPGEPPAPAKTTRYVKTIPCDTCRAPMTPDATVCPVCRTEYEIIPDDELEHAKKPAKPRGKATKETKPKASPAAGRKAA